jgi:hypothetical protein
MTAKTGLGFMDCMLRRITAWLRSGFRLARIQDCLVRTLRPLILISPKEDAPHIVRDPTCQGRPGPGIPFIWQVHPASDLNAFRSRLDECLLCNE